MLLGGVLLAAGMELIIDAADQLDGRTTIRLLLHTVAGLRHTDDTSWVILSGTQRPHGDVTVWCPCTVHVRLSALKRSCVLA